MSGIKLDEQFRTHILSSYPIDEEILDHLLDDLGDYFSENPEEYICRRHRILQKEGLNNEEIYRILRSELKERRFAVPGYSVRQIRRMIYG